MGSVQNQTQVILFAQFDDLFQLTHTAAVAHEGNGTGLVGDLLLHIHGIQTQVFIHVCEDGLQTLVQDGVVGGHKGNGRGDDLIAFLPVTVALQNIHGQMEAGGVGI